MKSIFMSIKKLLYSLYNFKRFAHWEFLKTIKHNYKRKKTHKNISVGKIFEKI